MQAFHNDPKVKAFYVDRLTEHHRLDQIIQGTKWDGSNGCNVGCVLHKYEHAAYVTELGLPEWYAHLCDKIFEGLPKDKAPAFAMATLTAIKPGIDIENVRWKLAIARHRRDLDHLATNTEPYAEECRTAIQGVISYCEQQIVGFSNESARSARSAELAAWLARSAELAAWLAARSAARSAESAESAARLAESAARSAESAHYIWEAETLISLLIECV